MEAYFGKVEVKQKYVARMRAHMDADELIRGTGFEGGKGCAVGCTLDRYDHSGFEEELGIPEWAARLLDALHENTSDDVWPTLSMRFLEAIEPGVDLSPVKSKINIFILDRNIERVYSLNIEDDLKGQVVSAIEKCRDLHVDKLRGVIAESAESAESAAWSAAESAWSAAESAARSAARSAESAAESAWLAAWSAAESEEHDAVAEELVRLLAEEGGRNE